MGCLWWWRGSCWGSEIIMGTKMARLGLTVCSLIVMAGLPLHAGARELRPADHGLQYQPAGSEYEKPPPKMMSFFGPDHSHSDSDSAVAHAPRTAPELPIPRALNTSETDPAAAAAVAVWNPPDGGDGSSSPGRTHIGGVRVRQVLLVGSLVCGIAGIALLAASALLFLFNFPKKNKTSSSLSSSSDHSQQPLPLPATTSLSNI